MNFAEIQWLYFLLLLPPFGFLLFRDIKKRELHFDSIISRDLWRKVLTRAPWRVDKKRLIVWCVGVAGLIVALARPQLGFAEKEFSVSGLDLMLVLDVSKSMDVEDVVPSRLRRGKKLVSSILQKLTHDRVGVIAFANSSFLASPLTTDLTYVDEVLQTIDTSSVPTQGTDIGGALESAVRALDRGAENLDGGAENPIGSKVVLLISDGEDLEKKAIDGAKALKAKGISLIVVGIGTLEGGPVPVRDDRGVLTGFKKDMTGKTVISKFNSEALKELADIAGGEFKEIGLVDQSAGEIISAISYFDRDSNKKMKKKIPLDRYQWPLLFALLMFLFELSLVAEKYSKPSAVGLALVSFLFASPLKADMQDDYRVYQENNLGVDAFEKDRVSEARKLFGGAQAYNPDDPLLLFNQGVVELKDEEYKNAETAFGSSARESDLIGNHRLSAFARYNLAEAQQKGGKLSEAKRTLADAIESAKLGKDKEFEDIARKKLEMLAQQQSKSKGKKGEEEESDGKGEGKEKEQEEGKGDKKEKSPKNVSRGNTKRQYQSKNLSKEDAERVMSELAAREKKLHMELRKGEKNQEGGSGRDW